MCGIAGVALLGTGSASPYLREIVDTMVSFMEHRGPDSRGLVSYEGVHLGACRLSILGLDPTSNQPLVSRDSKSCVVFNGEIYNYVELRSELMQLGYTFASTGDTEVVLHAYEEWGQGCLARLNGMFAFAIYSPKDQHLFIARDRFGVKPLYYSQQGSILLFASEPGAFLRTGLVSSEIDPHSLIDYLKFGVTDTENRSFFKFILQLPAGCFADISNGQMIIARWYELPRQVSRRTSRDNRPNSTSGFRTVFEDSIRLRMRSDVPVGILLSGGLDSSSVVGAASHIFDPRSIKAFTVSFAGTSVDELDYAKAVASRCRVPLVVENAEMVNGESLDGCIQSQQEPVISPSVVAQWLVMKAVHQSKVKVLLSGQGADEYLGGYAYFDSYAVRDFLARGQFGYAVRHVLNQRRPRRIFEILQGLIFLSLPARLKALAWKKSWLKEESHRPEECEYFREFVHCSNLHDALYFHLTRRLPELLRYEDRNSMAFSIETRHPFLDFRLVELALQTAPENIVGEGVRKRLLRSALGDLIDPKVLARTDKIGFQTPTEWLRSEEFRSKFNHFIEKAPQSLGRFIDFNRARRLLDGMWTSRRVNDAWRIYNLLLWYEQAVAGRETISPDRLAVLSSN